MLPEQETDKQPSLPVKAGGFKTVLVFLFARLGRDGIVFYRQRYG